MAQSLTENRHAGSFIVNELPGTQSRKEVTISNANGVAALSLEAGTVLGAITESNSDSLGETGAFVALNEGQTDGSQTAAGVLIPEVYLAAGETKKVALLVHEAIVRKSDLTWPESYDTTNINAALAVLAATPYFIQAAPPENDN